MKNIFLENIIYICLLFPNKNWEVEEFSGRYWKGYRVSNERQGLVD